MAPPVMKKFNQFCNIVNRVLDQLAPKRTVKISAKQLYMEPKGLEKSSSTKLKLYRAMLIANHTDEDIVKYKQHRNLYNKLKQTAKEEHF